MYRTPHSGQVRHFFAAQPVDPARPVGGDADGCGVDPGTPGPQEAREIVHIPSMAAPGPAKVVLPIPGSPVRWKKRP